MKARILVTPRSLTAERHPYVEELSALGFDVIYCTPGANSERSRIARVGARLRRLAGRSGVGDAARH